MVQQELWRSVLVYLLEARWWQSVVTWSRQKSALDLSGNKEGYRDCRVQGGEGCSVLCRKSKIVLEARSQHVTCS